MADLLSLSARDAARAIAERRLSAEALVAAYLDRIAAREPEVGAWEFHDREMALTAARACDSRDPSGPLHGIPIAVKDLIDTADMPTTYGSPIYRNHRPAADAPCVALARAAGAVVLGKTVTTEFACFTPGKTANPHNLARTPGGSSSGSAAAIAAGMAPLAFGTQTAGSIIRPASYCGVVGYKPSFGLIPRAGIKALCDSLDTVGTMARNVADAAFFAGVVSGRAALRDLAISASLDVGSYRIGYYQTPMWDEAEPTTVAALEHARAALGRAGAAIIELAAPAGHELLNHEFLTGAQEAIMGFELARNLAYERIEHSAKLSPRLGQMLDEGMSVGLADYEAAASLTAQARTAFDARSTNSFFGPCDALLVPAAPGEAPIGLGYTGNPIFNRMWTLLGTPCVTLPAIWGDSGLPTGIQLVGKIGNDVGLMRVALFAERALAAAQ